MNIYLFIILTIQFSIMKTTLLAILAFFFISCNKAPKTLSIDLASVNYFFEIADKIADRQQISDQEWDSLFNTKGYSILTKRIIKKNDIKEIMSLGFDPEQITQRDSLLSIPFEELMDGPAYTNVLMLRNIKDMQDNWDELKKFLKSYDFGLLEVNAIKKLREFLPNPIDSLLVLPPTSVLCMDPEARSLRDGIIMDFNLLYKNPNGMVGLLAHEMFHTYCSALVDHDFLYTNSVVAALELLLNEGLTDQVDKDNPYTLLEGIGIPDVIKEKYIYAYENTPQILQELDSLAVSYIDGNMEQKEFWRKAYNHIAFEGHPNGYYMTSMIKRQGLLDELKVNFANPVAFARIYNKAAAAENSYTFSEKFMKYIEDFENNYKMKQEQNNK